ncbi:MAG: amidase family protein, partial [Dehalococcoidia bacterium]|nr:amidase family protein [Dehalococcoidia bacterium]
MTSQGHRSEPAYESITELAPRIKSGEISPVEVVRSSLDRIAQLDPELNAFLETWEEQALEDARTTEKAIASGNYRGPLHGIPVGLKDLVDVAGYETTGGSKVLAG